MESLEYMGSRALDRLRALVYKGRMGRRLSLPEGPPIDAASKRQASKDLLLAALWTPVKNSRDLIQLALQMPRAYTRVLHTETTLLNLSNHQLTEFWFIEEVREKVLERPKMMVRYEFTQADFDVSERALVTMRPAVRALFQTHVDNMGIRSSVWMARALRRWADLEEAIRPENLGRKKKREKEEGTEFWSEVAKSPKASAAFRITLPKAYSDVLATDCTLLGLKLYQLIEFLALADLGYPVLRRPSFMPRYEFTRKHFDESESIYCYMRPIVKSEMERWQRYRGMEMSSWAALSLRKWANLDASVEGVK